MASRVMLFPIAVLFLSTLVSFFFFFFNDTATTEIYTLPLHDALPIPCCWAGEPRLARDRRVRLPCLTDRKSTRLNSSHQIISYAVFCLKKKNNFANAPILRVSS